MDLRFDTFNSGTYRGINSRTFYMLNHEVTIREFQMICPINDREFLHSKNDIGSYGDGYPVENITYLEAVIFCNSLSILLGKGVTDCYYNAFTSSSYGQDLYYPGNPDGSGCIFYKNPIKAGFRLPTEEEFKYACAYGSFDNATYPGSNSISSFIYSGNSNNTTSYIGHGRVQNTFDLAGNVAEFVSHCGDPNLVYYNALSSDTITIKWYGGSYKSSENALKLSTILSGPTGSTQSTPTNRTVSTYRSHEVGFRVMSYYDVEQKWKFE